MRLISRPNQPNRSPSGLDSGGLEDGQTRALMMERRGSTCPLTRQDDRPQGKPGRSRATTYRVSTTASFVSGLLRANACVSFLSLFLNKEEFGAPQHTHSWAAHPHPHHTTRALRPSPRSRPPSSLPPRPSCSLLWLWLWLINVHGFVGGARSFFRSFTRRTGPSILLRPPLRPAFKVHSTPRLAAAAARVSDRENRVALAGALVVEVLVHIPAMTQYVCE